MPAAVVAWGTYDARRHPRVKILLDGLRSSGVEVFEVNEPDSSSTADRVKMLHHPVTAIRWAGSLVGRWRRLVRAGRRTRKDTGARWLLVGYMGHFDVIVARLAFPTARIALDHLIFAADTARDRGATSKALLPVLRLLDAVALRCANLIVLDTEEHAALLTARQRRRSVVVPVGAQEAWFALAHHRHNADKPLRVVFFGLFTPLQGAPVIGAALSQLAASGRVIDATFIGTGQDEEAAKTALGDTPVTWLPWVEAEDLPRIVSNNDVCLGIFGTSEKARRVVPNKAYQGLAAGCAVVTSDTEPQRRAFGDAAVFVPPGDATALAHALAELVDHRDLVQNLRDSARSLASSFDAQAIGVSITSAMEDLT